jgi:NAD(P)-dependent dehydrogenase (short-subunit alcohol dehydrogenase family)
VRHARARRRGRGGGYSRRVHNSIQPDPERRQVALVTGGSRGIGAAVCTRLATDGHDIALGYAADSVAAEKVAEAVRAAGSRCVTVRLDVADPDGVDALFDAATGLGTLTGLVNNAGIGGPVGRLVDADPAGVRRVLEVNLLGSLLCARRAIRDMSRTGGGVIVNVSSAAATLGSPGEYVHYAATKAAVDTMTVGLAKEVAADGIRVNAVAPGVVWTDFHADPRRPGRLAETIPMGRAGRPEEIAAAVAWFFTGDAGYATGTVLRVAGGR